MQKPLNLAPFGSDTKKPVSENQFFIVNGGEGGIRTLDTDQGILP